MVTVNQILKKALALYDELLPSGERDPGKTEDYAGKTPAIVDMIQKELLRAGEYFKIYEISRSPFNNLFGFITGFDIKEFTGDDLIFECNNGGVKAYYFETDSNTGTAYIEDYTTEWNVLATITMSNTTNGFQPYKGSVTPTAGAKKTRIRFTGTYYYRTVNRALFNVAFEPGKEPEYMPWVKIPLPNDVKSIDQVITEFPERQYAKDATYKIETQGTLQNLYINYYYVGKIRVQYRPIPTEITALTDTLEIDDITAQLIAYGLAKYFAASEQNEFLTRIFDSKFMQLKAESYVKQPIAPTKITDVYGAIF